MQVRPPPESYLSITVSMLKVHIEPFKKCTVYTRRYVARVDKSHPLIALSSSFSVTDPLISRMVDSLAADITFSQFIEISTRK